MKSPVKQLQELYVKFGNALNKNPQLAFKILIGTFSLTIVFLALGIGISIGLDEKEIADFQNGKFNPSIKEANVLSVSKLTDTVKVDINGNGKFDKGDVSFFDKRKDIAGDSESIVYVDGVGKLKPLAYKRENGEYVIYKTPSSYFNKAEKLDKEFYDYMNDKKIFDLVKVKKEIDVHTK